MINLLNCSFISDFQLSEDEYYESICPSDNKEELQSDNIVNDTEHPDYNIVIDISEHPDENLISLDDKSETKDEASSDMDIADIDSEWEDEENNPQNEEVCFMICSDNLINANKIVQKAFEHFPLLQSPQYIAPANCNEDHHFLFSIKMDKQFIPKYFKMFETKRNRKKVKHLFYSCIMNSEEVVENERSEHCCDMRVSS